MKKQCLIGARRQATSVDKASIEAIRARLAHVLAYIAVKGQETLVCEAIDGPWITDFRKWLAAVPIVSPRGKKRKRSLATVKNSVLQLAAAINASGGIDARFKPQQPKGVNRTPQQISDVAVLAAMFRYCVDPAPGKQPAERPRRDLRCALAALEEIIDEIEGAFAAPITITPESAS